MNDAAQVIRKMVFALPVTMLAPGQRRVIVNQAHRGLTVERLILTAQTLPRWWHRFVPSHWFTREVAPQSVFVDYASPVKDWPRAAHDAIPIETFSPVAIEVPWSDRPRAPPPFDAIGATVQPGEQLFVGVQNFGHRAVAVTGGFIGSADAGVIRSFRRAKDGE